MPNNLAIIADALTTEDVAVLLRAAKYLAALPGTEYDEARLTRARAYAERSFPADAVRGLWHTRLATPGRQG